jgi:hypothetical protein
VSAHHIKRVVAGFRPGKQFKKLLGDAEFKKA